jgi:hypothetical protein
MTAEPDSNDGVYRTLALAPWKTKDASLNDDEGPITPRPRLWQRRIAVTRLARDRAKDAGPSGRPAPRSIAALGFLHGFTMMPLDARLGRTPGAKPACAIAPAKL